MAETTQIAINKKYLATTQLNGVEPVGDGLERLANTAAKLNGSSPMEGEMVEARAVGYIRYGGGEGWVEMNVMVQKYRVSKVDGRILLEPVLGEPRKIAGDFIPWAKEGDDDGDYVYFNVRFDLVKEKRTDSGTDTSTIVLKKEDQEAMAEMFEGIGGQ
jgi:hypothetical protein